MLRAIMLHVDRTYSIVNLKTEGRYYLNETDGQKYAPTPTITIPKAENIKEYDSPRELAKNSPKHLPPEVDFWGNTIFNIIVEDDVLFPIRHLPWEKPERQAVINKINLVDFARGEAMGAKEHDPGNEDDDGDLVPWLGGVALLLALGAVVFLAVKVL